MTDTPETQGQLIRKARTSIGWSQYDVADYLGCHQSLVSRAEDDDPRIQPIALKAFTEMCEKIEARILRAEDKPKLKAKQEGTSA